LYLRRITRSPIAYWAAVAVLAAITGLFVTRLVADAQAQRTRFGALRRVAIATRTLDAGHLLTTGDVAVRVVPRAFVPEGTADSARGLLGRTVVVPVFAGEAVLEAHLAPAGVRGIAALLAPGERAVAVPAGPATPAVRAGDRVDVLVSFEGTASDMAAEAATVIDTRDDAVTVALATDAARRVVDASARGAVTLAVRSPVEGRPA
jgi:pilus assembly protein CpaB